jgi:hypothetical protein
VIRGDKGNILIRRGKTELELTISYDLMALTTAKVGIGISTTKTYNEIETQAKIDVDKELSVEKAQFFMHLEDAPTQITPSKTLESSWMVCPSTYTPPDEWWKMFDEVK